MSGEVSLSGEAPRGGRYAIEVPPDWNGTLLLLSRGLPMGPADPPWEPGDPLVRAFLERGNAVAGTGGDGFWPLEATFANQDALLERFDAEVGAPARTIPWGFSIGGIMTAGLVQLFPERLAGALPLCGNLAGAVAIHNRELDIAFVVKTLLAGERPLEIAEISDPGSNLQLANEILAEARETPTGQARLALAAAVGNIPGWYDPLKPEPPADDFSARLENQVEWFEEVGFLVFFLLRAQVERQAGGNASWNTEVDYAELLRHSICLAEVEGLYGEAGLDLAQDLETLEGAERLEADPEAVAYLERHIVFTGDLGGVPVLTLHTDGDGLVTPDNEHAYGDVVAAAGQEDLLRRLYLHRGGHCTFSIAEVLVCLDALNERIASGTWPSLDPATLNAAAEGLGDSLNVLMRGGGSVAPAFADSDPPPFARQYDVRSSERPGPA